MNVVAALQDILPGAVLTEPAEMSPYEADWRHVHNHKALCVVLPDCVEQVAAAVRLCAQAGVGVVPQGGNTGLVAGAVPIPDAKQVVLSLKRMNKIIEVDQVGDTLTVEAGAILQTAQEHAARAGKLFPLSIAAEGTAQIGGLISTNAGGLHVLSYGSMRALVLGLQVVLADGHVWQGLRRLRKDNTGFDLKQIFIGSEGTLGIVTAAVLRLFPRVAEQSTALVGVASIDEAIKTFATLRAGAGAALTMCEFISAKAMRLAAAHVADARLPFTAGCYVLVELSGHAPDDPITRVLEDLLMPLVEHGTVKNVVVAQSERERAELLRLREAISDAELVEGGAIKHDVAVPLAALADIVHEVERLVEERFADCRLNIFGHIGDGNLHINLRPPEGRPLSSLNARKTAITEAVEALAMAHHGSFSAEHGIGQMRLSSMRRHKSSIELDLMRALKQALDPNGILNPGKVLPP